MSDPVVINPSDPELEALRAPALEALPEAAALLDSGLRLLQSNQALLNLAHRPRAGAALTELLRPLGLTPAVPADGATSEFLARAADGRPLQVTLRRRGEQVGLLARPLAVGAADQPLAVAMDVVEAQRRKQDALLALSRELALAASEDELVASISRCIRGLFPGRYFCVRIVDPRTYRLTSLYAEGRMLEGARERLAMRRSAADKAHVDPRTLPADRVVLTEEEPLVFAGSTRGFATPLSATGQFFGLVNLEYPQGLTADLARDEKLLIQLVNQAAIGVRNAKLIEELTFMKKYFEELIENANALILAVDRKNEVIVFNRALAQLTGYARAEVIGKNVSNLVPEAARDELGKMFERTLAGQPATNAEAVLRARGGQEIRVSVSTSAVLTAAGEVEGVIAIGQDLSRLRELERRVVQAEKLASLGQLAAGVVHEINNPLTTITMYAEALLQLAPLRGADAADVEKLQRIRESAERILRFARDLTSYARPAEDKPESIDLNAVLEQAARYCEHAFKQAGASLARGHGGTLPAIRGVRANLVQVFVNLLTNACHAIPRGGQVSVATREASNGVEVEVTDTGPGIEAAHLSRIFEPFFTTKPEGHGTGLGLTIVQSIVEKHGGTVRVSSTVGKGTTFTVWLPANGK
ncbi:MAG: two-component system sensor histidine kinase NtrB [Myxococcales bacterium]|jgi:two-component system NtrC family sensor kinase